MEPGVKPSQVELTDEVFTLKLVRVLIYGSLPIVPHTPNPVLQ